MHARHLVELGAWVAVRGTAGLRPPAAATRRHLEDYWLASRSRQDRWARVLKSAAQLPPDSTSARWLQLRPAFQEVLATELLTRVWAAVACAYDRQQAVVLYEPFVVHVVDSHAEARQRVTRLVVRGHGCALAEGAALHRLRRATAAWTDQLLGYLAHDTDVTRFAFQAGRARQFAADARDRQHHPLHAHAAGLTWSSLRACFARELTDASPNPDLNARIADSVLACCDQAPASVAPSPTPDWLRRMSQLADHAAAWVDDLLLRDGAEPPAAAGRPPGARP